MTTTELANFIAPFLGPAREVVASLPLHSNGTTTGRISCSKPNFENTARTPIDQLHELVKMNPSKRTYYLGKCGRVSQRKQLVGEVIATVRAFTTDHARYLFSDYETMRTYPVSVPKPFIGEAVLCKCGWHHAKKAECPVCANWKHIGQQIVAGEAEA